MSAPFQTECTALRKQLMAPPVVVSMARRLECPELLAKAFPSMPQHLMDDIYNGDYEIREDRDEPGYWLIKPVSERMKAVYGPLRTHTEFLDNQVSWA